MNPLQFYLQHIGGINITDTVSGKQYPVIKFDTDSERVHYINDEGLRATSEIHTSLCKCGKTEGVHMVVADEIIVKATNAMNDERHKELHTAFEKVHEVIIDKGRIDRRIEVGKYAILRRDLGISSCLLTSRDGLNTSDVMLVSAMGVSKNGNVEMAYGYYWRSAILTAIDCELWRLELYS